jgi:dolichol-phosphate mannosyltransferase
MNVGLTPAPEGPLRIDPAFTPILRLSLVLPTYNEADNIEPLLTELEHVLTPALGDAYELIVVDDDSPDETWRRALAKAETSPRVRVIRRNGGRGLATAVVRGWQVARGEILGVMDADRQHPSELLTALLAEVARGAELAVASRHTDGGGVSDWRLGRRIISRGAQLLGMLLLPGSVGRLSDPMSGYFLVRRSVLAGIVLQPMGYKILLEVLARAPIRLLSEVGYVFRERSDGKSKVSLRVYGEYVVHLWRLRETR